MENTQCPDCSIPLAFVGFEGTCPKCDYYYTMEEEEPVYGPCIHCEWKGECTGDCFHCEHCNPEGFEGLIPEG